jgi:hypothetical protein
MNYKLLYPESQSLNILHQKMHFLSGANSGFFLISWVRDKNGRKSVIDERQLNVCLSQLLIIEQLNHQLGLFGCVGAWTLDLPGNVAVVEQQQKRLKQFSTLKVQCRILTWIIMAKQNNANNCGSAKLNTIAESVCNLDTAVSRKKN